MYSKLILSAALAMLLGVFVGCSSRVPHDEARARYPNEDYSSPKGWRKAAEDHYGMAYYDYFQDMDRVAEDDKDEKDEKEKKEKKERKLKNLKLSADAVKGRNAWVMWAGGNEAFWDWLGRHSYGSQDLLKLVDPGERAGRFGRTGLINEPGMREPTDKETLEESNGVRYMRPIAGQHVEYRPGVTPPEYKVYGYPSGVVGLRIFKNPEFTAEAAARWDSKRYYSDPVYASRPDTIRPYRVAMSCGYCHIAPHPLNPPPNVEKPEWEHLSNNIGNQYLRFRSAFSNMQRPDNFLYHVLDAQLPGALDTSLVPADNINNPNTINPFFGLPGRLARAKFNPKETIGSDTADYLREYVFQGQPFDNPHEVPRVLLDGSDSVGVHIALSRVYLNIGTHHQQWVRLHNPLVGFRKQQPFKLKDIAENSLYWHATLIRVDPLAQFFLASTDPMRLKDAPLDDKQRAEHIKGSGVPWDKEYAKGQNVFAKGCIACHSSVQPGDLPDLEIELTAEGLPAIPKKPENWDKLPPAEKQRLVQPRAVLRLKSNDLHRLTRGDGTLPTGYALWAAEAVKSQTFWVSKNASGQAVHNYLAIDDRIPVTMTHTNSQRAAATNALHGNLWEDFASQTYKELDSVGTVHYHDPFSGAEKSYRLPAGGPGYYRVPSLISAWATAPFLHNNALGLFNNDPSVQGRLNAFDDAAKKLLWPEKRRVAGQQVVWDSDRPEEVTVFDGWYEGKRRQNISDQKSAASQARASAQLEADRGWIWRTSEESWIMLHGHDIPIMLSGFTGWSSGTVYFLSWLPTLVLFALGLGLILSRPIIAWRQRLATSRPWLNWILEPLRWGLTVGSLLLAVGLGYLILFEHYTTICFLAVVTRSSVWWLFTLFLLIPGVFLAGFAAFFSLHWIRSEKWRSVIGWSGGVFLVLSIVVAFTFGAFLAGRGDGIKFGPIPEGVPVNIIANLDPQAPSDLRREVLFQLRDFVLEYDRATDKKPGRAEFEARVAPALLRASKSPDFVMDRGHDYELINRLTDTEKQALIELLKSF